MTPKRVQYIFKGGVFWYVSNVYTDLYLPVFFVLIFTSGVKYIFTGGVFCTHPDNQSSDLRETRLMWVHLILRLKDEADFTRGARSCSRTTKGKECTITFIKSTLNWWWVVYHGHCLQFQHCPESACFTHYKKYVDFWPSILVTKSSPIFIYDYFVAKNHW